MANHTMLFNLDDGGVKFRRANFILFLPALFFMNLKISLSAILEGSLSLDLRTLKYLSLLLYTLLVYLLSNIMWPAWRDVSKKTCGV